MLRRKERNESHLYMNVNVLLEDNFDGHQGHDLFDIEQTSSRVFKTKKESSVDAVLDTLSKAFVSVNFVLIIPNFTFCMFTFRK